MVLLYTLVSVISTVSLKCSRDELLLLRYNGGQASTQRDLREIEEFCQSIEVNQSVHGSTEPRNIRHYRRKRGKRGGLLVRLRRHNCKTPVPSMIVTHVQRLANKMGELMYRIGNQRDYKECCVLFLRNIADTFTP